VGDLKKFEAPPMAGEVTEALINVRLSMHQLLAMILTAKSGNAAQFEKAQSEYIALDTRLQKIINRVGGLDGPK
jgi:hypothetical protein